MTKHQSDLEIDNATKLISLAHEKGINFFDTAEIYDNYHMLAPAVKQLGRENFIITSKTYAYSKEGAQESLNLYLKELGTDYADIFLLHEQESELTLKGHYEALKELFRLKENGYIRAIGISTHKIAAVRAALKYKEIDIIHPMINKSGLGILDGTRDEMLSAIDDAKKANIGIYAMKVLGGGHLISNASDSIRWAVEQDNFDSIALGMQSEYEIIANTCLINGEVVTEEILKELRSINRQITVEEYCVGCGKCAKVCQAGAIKIIDGRAVIDEKCILCGYCANACPDFYIKVV